MVTPQGYTVQKHRGAWLATVKTFQYSAAIGLILATLAGTTNATTDGDCGSGGDAGGSFATALSIAPSAYCDFTLDTLDADYFTFELSANEVAYFVYLRGDIHTVYDPTGAPYTGATSTWGDITTLTSSTGGAWYLRFPANSADDPPRERAFGLYGIAIQFEGQVAVGGTLTHGLEADGLEEFDGANGYLGPGNGPVVDGQWFDLPTATTGIEMLFHASGEPSVWFYDAVGEWIEYYDCGALGSVCRAPAGATRVLVTDNDAGVSSPIDDFRFAFDLYW